MNRHLPRYKILSVLIICVTSIVIFWPATKNHFAFDDILQITYNPWITNTNFIPDIFISHVWDFCPMWVHDPVYYRPMMHLAFLAEYTLFGLNATFFHATNIILHITNALLLFFLLIRLQHLFNKTSEKNTNIEKTFILRSFLGTIIFALHPVQSETINWISAIPELLLTFFSLIALLFYLSNKWRFLTMLPFFLALLSKESAVFLLLVFFITNCLQKNLSFRYWHRNILPWIKKNYSILFPLITYLLIRILLSSDSEMKFLNWQSLLISLIRVPENISRNIIEKIILPFNLSILNALPFDIFYALFYILGFVIFLFLLILLAKKRNWTFSKESIFGILFSLLTYCLAFLPLGLFSLSERYLYLPMVGVALIISMSISRKKVFIWIFLSFFIPLSFLIHRERIPEWKNTITLFESIPHPENEPPDKFLQIQKILMNEYALQGNKKAFFQEKQLLYDTYRIIDTFNTYHEAYLYLISDEPKKTIELLNWIQKNNHMTGTEIKPLIYYRDLAIAHYIVGNKKESENYLQKMLTEDPSNFLVHQTIAHFFCYEQNQIEAEKHFQLSLQYGNLKERIVYIQSHCSNQYEFIETFRETNLLFRY